MSEAVAADMLRSFVSRIEKLDGEINDLNVDKREVYQEAKGMGFDLKPLRRLIQLRRMGLEDRQEFEAVLEMYKAAMGMDGTIVATRARTDSAPALAPSFDPDTGEIVSKPITPAPASDLPKQVHRSLGGAPLSHPMSDEARKAVLVNIPDQFLRRTA